MHTPWCHECPHIGHTQCMLTMSAVVFSVPAGLLLKYPPGNQNGETTHYTKHWATKCYPCPSGWVSRLTGALFIKYIFPGIKLQHFCHLLRMAKIWRFHLGLVKCFTCSEMWGTGTVICYSCHCKLVRHPGLSKVFLRTNMELDEEDRYGQCLCSEAYTTTTMSSEAYTTML